MCDIPERDLYWLAGLLEGEASFHLCKERGARQVYPVIKLKMCDRDVVERAALLMTGTEHVLAYQPTNPKHKPNYALYVIGSRAIPWLHRLRPLMGARRQEQIDQMLDGMTAIDPTRNKKLNVQKVAEIKALWAERAMTQIEIAKLYGVSKWTVNEVINGHTWGSRKYRARWADQ